MSINRKESHRSPQVQYGTTRILVDPADAPRLIACLAVVANPTNPQYILIKANECMEDFALEREALYRGTPQKTETLV